MYKFCFSTKSPLSVSLINAFKDFSELVDLDNETTRALIKKEYPSLVYVPALIYSETVIQGIELYRWINDNKDSRVELESEPVHEQITENENLDITRSATRTKADENIKIKAENMAREREENINYTSDPPVGETSLF